jgi:hypothetical protein
MAHLLESISAKTKKTESRLSTYKTRASAAESQLEKLKSTASATQSELEACKASLADTKSELEVHKATAMAVQSQLESARLENDKMLSKIRQQSNAKCCEIRQQLLDVMQDRDKQALECQYQPEPEPEIELDLYSLPSQPLVAPQTSKRWAFLVPLFVVVASVLALISSQYSEHYMDTLCAPVQPGVLLEASAVDQVFEAPWWASQEYKSTAFALCGQRARVELSLSKGKVTAAQMAGQLSVTLWQHPANKVQVLASELALEQTKKGKTMVTLMGAPWTLKK